MGPSGFLRPGMLSPCYCQRNERYQRPADPEGSVCKVSVDRGCGFPHATSGPVYVQNPTGRTMPHQPVVEDGNGEGVECGEPRTRMQAGRPCIHRLRETGCHLGSTGGPSMRMR